MATASAGTTTTSGSTAAGISAASAAMIAASGTTRPASRSAALLVGGNGFRAYCRRRAVTKAHDAHERVEVVSARLSIAIGGEVARTDASLAHARHELLQVQLDRSAGSLFLWGMACAAADLGIDQKTPVSHLLPVGLIIDQGDRTHGQPLLGQRGIVDRSRIGCRLRRTVSRKQQQRETEKH